MQYTHDNFQRRILEKTGSLQMYDTFQNPQQHRNMKTSDGNDLNKNDTMPRFYNSQKLIHNKSNLAVHQQKYYDDSSVIEFHLTD